MLSRPDTWEMLKSTRPDSSVKVDREESPWTKLGWLTSSRERYFLLRISSKDQGYNLD